MLKSVFRSMLVFSCVMFATSSSHKFETSSDMRRVTVITERRLLFRFAVSMILHVVI
jgi:hypothetical protein